MEGGPFRIFVQGFVPVADRLLWDWTGFCFKIIHNKLCYMRFELGTKPAGRYCHAVTITAGEGVREKPYIGLELLRSKEPVP